MKMHMLNAGVEEEKRAQHLLVAHQFYREVKTPRPLASATVVVERVHLVLSHEQYACALRLLSALQASPSSSAVPAAPAVPAVPAVPAAAPVNKQAFAVELVSDEQPVAALFAVLVA